jgi:hypothetical protein
MKGNIKSWLAILMGIIILVADVLWIMQSTYDMYWLALGGTIFVADVIWLVIDYSFMKK